MKIVGPNNETLAENGVLMFTERTCGECALLRELGDGTCFCIPLIPVWQLGGPSRARSKDDSAEGCACFVAKS